MEEGYNSDYEFRDWAHLPSVAVHLISQNIKSIADYVRFGAICTPWRSASHGNSRRHFCPHLLWLMIPYAPMKREMHGTDDDGMSLFYDMWESKMCRLHLPETIGKSCCASYRGWLLLSEYRGAELFFPEFFPPPPAMWFQPSLT